MITKRGDVPVTEQAALFDGTGVLKNTHFLRKEDSCDAGRLFARSVLAKGHSIGQHTHRGEFEVYYILSGTARVCDNGDFHELSAGDVLLTKNGEYHSIENIGEDDLQYIAIILFDKTSSSR